MEKFNLKGIRLDSIAIMLIPVLLLVSLQMNMKSFPFYTLVALVMSTIALIGYSLYRYTARLNEMTWQHHLNSTIQKVSSAVLVADKEHKIIYANDNFYRLPLARIINRHYLLPEFIREVTQDKQPKSRQAIKDLLEGLTANMKIPFTWQDEPYDVMLVSLMSPTGKRFGTLLECSKRNAIIGAQDSVCSDSTHFPIHEQLKQGSYPTAIIDLQGNIQQGNDTFNQLLSKDAPEGNFFNYLEKLKYSTLPYLKKAVSSKRQDQFLFAHDNKLYDLMIKPLAQNHEVIGFLIEMQCPSVQELKAYEESWLRWQQRARKIEGELVKFTRGLGKFNLYQKEGAAQLETFKVDEYHHPLLKNMSKMVQQIGHNLHKLYSKVDSVIPSAPVITHNPSTSIKQINVIASAIHRNAYEIHYDFNGLHDEVAKIKALIKDQKGLNQSYIKPILNAVRSTEQALIHTVKHSETLTLVLQSLHENQNCLEQFQQFTSTVNQLTKQDQEQAQQFPIEIFAFIDDVKQAVGISKQKLSDLLVDNDKMKHYWGNSLENLKACIQMNSSLDATSDKLQGSNRHAEEIMRHLQLRLQHLLELTEKAYAKSAPDGAALEIPIQESARHFDKVVIEIEENKKKAEDVLLEGLEKKSGD